VGQSRILALRKPILIFHSQTAAWAAFLTVSAGGAYLLVFAITAFAEPWWVKLPGALALGPLIALLFRMAHDAGHGSHFGHAGLDRWVCRLTLLPSYHPHSVWLLLHNGRHHSFTNLKDNDYIWIPHSKAEYDAMSSFARLLERIYRTSPGTGLYYLCVIWAGMITVRPSLVRKVKPIHRRDALVAAGFFAAQSLVLGIDGPDLATFGLRIAATIVVPFLVFNWLVGFTSFLNHTHPQVPWFSRRDEWSFYEGQVHCTVHVGVPKWMIFFLTDLGLHGAHHIDPRIPIWKLEPAEALIRAAAPHDMVIEPWTFRRHRQIMRACKLYDYERHRWLDFAGRPTTPVIEIGSVEA
jgi:omega-6 fatty acid desaturase (delta-12 desaturase)